MLNAFSIMTLFVNVKDNNLEQAIRSLKKKMQREGLYKEMKLRKHFEKPCLKKSKRKKKKIFVDQEKLLEEIILKLNF